MRCGASVVRNRVPLRSVSDASVMRRSIVDKNATGVASFGRLRTILSGSARSRVE